MSVRFRTVTDLNITTSPSRLTYLNVHFTSWHVEQNNEHISSKCKNEFIHQPGRSYLKVTLFYQSVGVVGQNQVVIDLTDSRFFFKLSRILNPSPEPV